MKQSAAPIRRFDARGFTIIEIMTAMAILGVLLAIGVPNFTAMIRNNRTASLTNSFIGSISTTRSEAVTRGIPMTICAANAARTNCEGENANPWSNGWLIFTDRTGDPGVVDGTDQIIMTSDAIRTHLTIDSGNVGFLRFWPDGSLAVPTATFNLTHEYCSGENRREIVIDIAGRSNMQKRTCP